MSIYLNLLLLKKIYDYKHYFYNFVVEQIMLKKLLILLLVKLLKLNH